MNTLVVGESRYGWKRVLAAGLTILIAMLALLYVVGWFRLPVFQDRWEDLLAHALAGALGTTSVVALIRASRRGLNPRPASLAAAFGSVVCGYLLLADGYTYLTYSTGCFTRLEVLLGIAHESSWVRSMELVAGSAMLFGGPLLSFVRFGRQP